MNHPTLRQNRNPNFFSIFPFVILDARGFSCADSGFGQVLKSEHEHAQADETKLPVAREKKPLVPRASFCTFVCFFF